MIIMCCYTQMNAVIVKTWYLVVLAIICIMAVLESKPEKYECSHTPTPHAARHLQSTRGAHPAVQPNPRLPRLLSQRHSSHHLHQTRALPPTGPDRVRTLRNGLLLFAAKELRFTGLRHASVRLLAV